MPCLTTLALAVTLAAPAMTGAAAPAAAGSGGGAEWRTAAMEPAEVRALLEAELDARAVKRMSFYAQRVLEELAAVATDDAASAGSGAALDPRATDRLREAVRRFVDAGERSGLAREEQIAFLEQAHEERYSGPVPAGLRLADGRLDAKGLLRGVTGYDRAPAPADPLADRRYISTIAAEGAATLATVDRDETAPVAVVAPEPPVEELDPKIADVLARVKGDGFERVLRVEQGDTLGLIARAIYGDSLRYRDIFSANRAVLGDPNVLPVGVDLYLPPS